MEQDEIERMIVADLELYRQIRPDLVLTDGRFTASISTHIARLRHAAIVNVSSTEYRAMPYIPIFEWLSGFGISQDSGIKRYADRLNLKIEMFIFDHAMNVFHKLSKKHGLEKRVTATNCLAGKDITLLSDIPEYFPVRHLPGNYHFIGPITLKTALPPPNWWPPEKDGHPLIYITMGSTGISSFFMKVYEYFKQTEMKAVITTGGQVKSFAGLSGKIYIEQFIDGDLVLEKSDLVVCHGGNGTIYQALLHGKPIIGIPTIPDQKFNMRRVESLGMGISIPYKNFYNNQEILINAIEKILRDPSYSNNAVRFQKKLEKYHGYFTGANLIESCFAS
ncbi:MAG: glycosyltransferase [Desulfobacterales bacterium]|nr:glycosyltransferase [Desulfobacterales bacterium]